MQLETLKAHCFYLYSALHIPIYILEGRGGNDAARHVIIEAFPEQEACCHPLEILKRIQFPDERNVLFLTSSFSAGFGIIRIMDSKYTLMVGPQFAVPFSNPVYLEISKKYSFDAEQKGLIYAFFNGIPVASSLALKQTLRMMHHFLNPGLDEEIVDVFDEEETDRLRKNQYGEYYEMQEGGYHNNSMAVEREVCKIVEQGDVAAFTKFVRNVPYLSVGITSSSPLRQKKICFSSQSNFQNAFKQQYRLTPKQYRETIRRDIKEIREIKGIKGAEPSGGGNGSPSGNGGCHGANNE